MTTPTYHWKQPCATVEDLRIITDNVSGPLVAFTPLALSPCVKSYIASWEPEQFVALNQKSRISRTLFAVSGFHLDPALSGRARSQVAKEYHALLPGGDGRIELAETLADRYTRLASIWDCERLLFNLRIQHRPEPVAHIDHQHQYASIANLRDTSTLFVPPMAYAPSDLQHRYLPGSEGEYVIECKLTEQRRNQLEGLPDQSLGCWRGLEWTRPALHLVPDTPAFRVISLAHVCESKPALR